MSFNSTAKCAKFAEGQLEAFAGDTETVVIGEIVLALPYTAYPELQNSAAQVVGKVLVIKRGESTFLEKAERAQAAGAAGVIIVNNVPGDAFVMAGSFAAIMIPVVMVPMSAEAALQASQGTPLTITVDAGASDPCAHLFGRTRPPSV